MKDSLFVIYSKTTDIKPLKNSTASLFDRTIIADIVRYIKNIM